MNNNIKTLVSFAVGVAVGVIATYKIADQKYSNIANEEIESVKDTFINRQPIEKQETVIKIAEERKDPIKPSISEYNSVVKTNGYNQISKQNSKKEMEAEDEMSATSQQTDSIYTITPDEFNTIDDYKSVTLYYTANNYVVDADMEVMSDDEIKRTIGHDPMGNFGEYEDDSVYVRNEELMTDYEILMSEKTLGEIQEG